MPDIDCITYMYYDNISDVSASNKSIVWQQCDFVIVVCECTNKYVLGLGTLGLGSYMYLRREM